MFVGAAGGTLTGCAGDPGGTAGVICEIPLTSATGGRGAIARSSWSRSEIACPALLTDRNFMRLPTTSGVLPAAAVSTAAAKTTSKTAPRGAKRFPSSMSPTSQTTGPAGSDGGVNPTAAPVRVEFCVTTALPGR